MSELKAGAVYIDDYGDVLLAITDGVNYNAVSLVGDDCAEYGETILFTYVSAAEAFDHLECSKKVADSLAEYYESKK